MEDLAALPPFAPGTRLLVLFGCIRAERKWTLFRRKLPLRKLTGCEPLGALRRLSRFDLHKWVEACDHLRGRVHGERLRRDLDVLFPSDSTKVRYEAVRAKLLHEGSLRRAMKMP